MNTELLLNTPEMSQIEISKAEKIRATFLPMVQRIAEFENSYNEVIADAEKGIDAKVSAKAKRVRLDISKVRIEVEKIRKFEKEEYLRAGKAIDGVANIFKWATTDKEGKLEAIEKHAEIMEQQRLADLQEKRVIELLPFCQDASERNLSTMDDDVWNAYLSTKRKEFTDKIEAEKQAEIERQRVEAERIEQLKQQRIEAERLKVEQAKLEADKAIAIEQQRVANAKLEAERQEAIRLKFEAEKKIQAIKNAIQAEKEEIERQKQQAEREMQAKLEAEQKVMADEQARSQNKENIKNIHRGILAKFLLLGCPEDIAKSIIISISKGEIDNLTIKY